MFAVLGRGAYLHCEPCETYLSGVLAEVKISLLDYGRDSSTQKAQGYLLYYKAASSIASLMASRSCAAVACRVQASTGDPNASLESPSSRTMLRNISTCNTN